MKFIIDIDEDVRVAISRMGLLRIPDEMQKKVDEAIQHSTPLPKGHGRIADMDAAIKCIEEVEGEDAIWAISLIEWACSKRTIIEADKAESEG